MILLQGKAALLRAVSMPRKEHWVLILVDLSQSVEEIWISFIDLLLNFVLNRVVPCRGIHPSLGDLPGLQIRLPRRLIGSCDGIDWFLGWLVVGLMFTSFCCTKHASVVCVQCILLHAFCMGGLV